MSGMFSLLKAEVKVQELQKKTGKSYNECSSALHLANGDVNKAMKIMRENPEYDKRVKRR